MLSVVNCAKGATWLSSSVYLVPQNPRKSRTIFKCASAAAAAAGESASESGNYAGVELQQVVENTCLKSRIDSWISSRAGGVSRARVQSSIRSGLVSVNGRVIHKVSHVIKAGDKVNCTISELQPLRAEPEDIPLDIVYEDAHVLVVNKPAHMVVHPAPGNANGTLVNGILHHCTLPTIAVQNNDIHSESEDGSDVELDGSLDEQRSFMATSNNVNGSSVRPGIVHRLDKGTSGVLVVAKDEHSHAHLSEQFKQHTIHRVYISLTSGVPSPISGRIEVPIGRDTNNRIRMVAIPGCNNSRQARQAARTNYAHKRKLAKLFHDCKVVSGIFLILVQLQWVLKIFQNSLTEKVAKKLQAVMIRDPGTLKIKASKKDLKQKAFFVVLKTNPDSEVLIRTMKKIWVVTDEFHIELLKDNRFSDSKRRKTDRVYDGGPWHSEECLLVLAKTVGLVDLMKVSLNTQEFWVQFHGFPPALLIKNMCIHNGEKLGTISFVDVTES